MEDGHSCVWKLGRRNSWVSSTALYFLVRYSNNEGALRIEKIFKKLTQG